MKTMKTVTIATIITIVIILACSFAVPACADVVDRGEFYPKLTIVVDYQHMSADVWVIDCMDRDGNIWSFYGEEEDAHIGIMFNLLMWNVGEAEEEDELIEAYYEGRLDEFQIAKWMEEWR